MRAAARRKPNRTAILRRLRQRRPERDFSTGFLTYTATFDVSQTALAKGATPSALVYAFSSRPEHPEKKNWRSVAATPLSGASKGFSRFSVTFIGADDGELNTTSAGSYEARLVPYLQFPNGGRLFDHNRHEVPGKLDSYALSYNLNFRSIGDDTTICASH